jgi:hypothetical protein
MFSGRSLLNFQQDGTVVAYFGNSTFIQFLTIICEAREGGEAVGLDTERKRLRNEALAYTGCLVNFYLFFPSIYQLI